MAELAVKMRFEAQDEGLGHAGSCRGCGRGYKSALFLDRPASGVVLMVECECGQQVQMGRIGTVRHRSSPLLRIYEGMK